MTRPTACGQPITIPPRDELVRHGIPVEVIQRCSGEAQALRAAAFRDAFARLRRWALFWPRRGLAFGRGATAPRRPARLFLRSP